MYEIYKFYIHTRIYILNIYESLIVLNNILYEVFVCVIIQ